MRARPLLCVCVAAQSDDGPPPLPFAVVNGTPVTVIEDGFVIIRSLVSAAIDPTKEVVSLTVFRQF